jgi:hypothetical protein
VIEQVVDVGSMSSSSCGGRSSGTGADLGVIRDATTTSATTTTSNAAEATTGNHELVCEECGADGKHTPATVRCVDCDNTLYCDACNARAHRLRKFAGHKRVPPTSTSTPAPVPTPSSSGLPCSTHAPEPVMMFCTDDRTLVCPQCIATSHCGHKCTTISQALDLTDINHTKTTIETWITKFKAAIPHIATSSTNIEAQCTAIQQQIYDQHDKICREFLALMRESRDELLKDIADRTSIKKQQLANQHKTLCEQLSQCEAWSQQVSQFMGCGDHARAVDAVLKMEGRAKELESKAPQVTACVGDTAVFRCAKAMDAAVMVVGRVTDSDAVASQCRADGDGVVVMGFNRPNTFTITAVKEDGEQCDCGGAVFDVRIDGAPDANIRMMDVEDGRYEVQYTVPTPSSSTTTTPGRPGPFHVHVEYRGEQIGGSPFGPLRFVDSSKCTVSGDLLVDAVVGFEGRVVVTAKDVDGNQLPFGGDDVGVKVAAGGTTTDAVVVDNHDGTYTGTYTPTAAGDEAVHVMVYGQPIQGSPFEFESKFSRILDAKMHNTLQDMLPTDRRRLTKLHDSKDGATHTDFWRVVLNKSCILVVVQMSNGYVCCGYVEDQFIDRSGNGSSGYFRGSDRNFVGRLAGGDGPLKLYHSKADQFGVYMDTTSCQGLLMGGNSDLRTFESNGQVHNNLVQYRSRAPGQPIDSSIPANALTGLAAATWHQPAAMEIFQCGP